MLKKAAVLLFHPRPDRIFTGASIKIGFFRTDDDLAYQDEILGSLFEQVDKVMDLLQTKYLSIKKNDHYMNAVEYCIWGIKEYLDIMI